MSIAPLRTLAFVLLVLVTGATSIGCTTAAAGKVTTAEMPAPAADPVVSTETSWADFLDWATATSKEADGILGTFADDAGDYDIDAMVHDAIMLDRWALKAGAWLNANPPQSCYAAIHATYGSAITHMGKSASLIVGGVTVKNLKASAAEMSLGTADVQEATALMKSVSC